MDSCFQVTLERKVLKGYKLMLLTAAADDIIYRPIRLGIQLPWYLVTGVGRQQGTVHCRYSDFLSSGWISIVLEQCHHLALLTG